MEYATLCPICETSGNSRQVYSSNVNHQTLNAVVFSARRLPDRQHYQWVRCLSCGLLRSDPVLTSDLKKLYESSAFDYSPEIGGLKKTYLGLVKRVVPKNAATRSIFEVGGGNGFFLEAAKDFGFKTIAGIEPSFLAVASAREDVKPYMIASMMDDSILLQESFQMGVMFHTLDHLQDPVKTLKQCMNALESGGVFIVAVHNERSWSARLFGKRSPIIDVEHTHLYSRNTGAKIFQKVGFEQVRTGSYMNHYTLAYFFHLLPISRSFKRLVLAGPIGRLMSKVKLVLPLGNMWIAGIKP